jgi:hypothetical protein
MRKILLRIRIIPALLLLFPLILSASDRTGYPQKMFRLGAGTGGSGGQNSTAMLPLNIRTQFRIKDLHYITFS